MTTNRKNPSQAAEVLREYGPYPGMKSVHGVTFDGTNIWFARGDSIVALDPESGKPVRELAVAADAGTAFDGKHLWQLADERIQKVDPQSGQVLMTIPAPSRGGDSGLTWAEGTLWVGEYRARRIHQIDTDTGAILRTIESDRFVTGVTWVDGELWHGTWEGEHSDLRRINPTNGAVLERLEMPGGGGSAGWSPTKAVFFIAAAAAPERCARYDVRKEKTDRVLVLLSPREGRKCLGSLSISRSVIRPGNNWSTDPRR